MDYSTLSNIFFILGALCSVIAGVFMRKDRVFFAGLISCVIFLCIAMVSQSIDRRDSEVNFMIFEIEDGYHLQCDNEDDLRKIAEVLPEIPEAELTKMDFETLSLQKSVDWKVNALAVEIEKNTRTVPGRIDSGYKQIKEVSRAEIERAITEYVSRDKYLKASTNLEETENVHSNSYQIATVNELDGGFTARIEAHSEAVKTVSAPGKNENPSNEKTVMMSKVAVFSSVGFFVLMIAINLLFICRYIVNAIFWKRMVALRGRVAERAVEVYGYKPGGVWFNRRVDEFQKTLQDEKVSSAWYLSYFILNFQGMPATYFFTKRDFPEIYSLKSFYSRLLEEMERVESLNKRAKENGKKIECENPIWEVFLLNKEEFLSFVFINKINNENDEILLPRQILENAIKVAKGDYSDGNTLSEYYSIYVGDLNQIIFFVYGESKTCDRVTIDVRDIEKFM